MKPFDEYYVSYRKHYFKICMKKVLIISSLCTAISFLGAISEAGAQTLKLPDEIVRAFVGGDAKTICKYFDSSVELILSEIGGVYAKVQAEQILKDFFNKNASANQKFNYKDLRSSIRDNAQYFIGELHTGKGIYRVNIYMKDQRIFQLRIDND